MSATLDKIIEEVRALPPDQQRQLRDELETIVKHSGDGRARRRSLRPPPTAAVSVELPRRIGRTTDTFFVEPAMYAARPMAHTPARQPELRTTIALKLLIVEDNPQMRQMIRAVVADLTEADGAAAVAAACATEPLSSADRVLMDVQMWQQTESPSARPHDLP